VFELPLRRLSRSLTRPRRGSLFLRADGATPTFAHRMDHRLEFFDPPPPGTTLSSRTVSRAAPDAVGAQPPAFG
jgi:hypothetical protein